MKRRCLMCFIAVITATLLLAACNNGTSSSDASESSSATSETSESDVSEESISEESSSDAETDSNDEKEVLTVDDVSISSLTVECIKNMKNNTYNVQVKLDDEYIGDIQQGETVTFLHQLPRGKHVYRFENPDNKTVYGEYIVQLTENTVYNAKIYCGSMGVSVKDKSNNAESVSNHLIGQSKNRVSCADVYPPGEVYEYAYCHTLDDFVRYILFDEDTSTLVTFDMTNSSPSINYGEFIGTFSTSIRISVTRLVSPSNLDYEEMRFYSDAPESAVLRRVYTDGSYIDINYGRVNAQLIEGMFKCW